jgi:dCMP deaminase
MQRENYISWDEYFMALAILSAERSKDPNSQVGSCIVSDNKMIMSMGYNGFPKGIDDKDLPWGRDGDFLDTKYAYVVHSEANAIMNAQGRDLKGCTLYVALFPCNECAKLIIQAGLEKIIYFDDKYKDSENNIATRKMFDLAGIKYEKYQQTKRKIEIRV